MTETGTETGTGTETKKETETETMTETETETARALPGWPSLRRVVACVHRTKTCVSCQDKDTTHMPLGAWKKLLPQVADW